MLAYIVDTGQRIYPFGDSISTLPVANEPIGAAQDRVVRSLGFEVKRIRDLTQVEETPALLTFDYVFFTRRVTRDFLKAARATGRSCRCALPKSVFTDVTVPGTGLQPVSLEGGEAVPYDLYYLAENKSWMRETLDNIEPVIPRFKEKVIQSPVPSRLVEERYRYSITSSVVFHVHNWFHLYRANMQALTIRWVEQILGHKLWTFSRLLFALPWIPFHGFWALAKRLNVKAKGCKIHPTAVVELSHLGRNVHIGAGAIVRGCILGDDTYISDGSHLQYTIMGERCFTSKSTILNGVVSMNDSDVCPAMQVSLVGRECSVTARSWILDINLKGNVKIFDGEKTVDTGTSYLGACLGHGVKIGFDVVIGHGRAIPNGLTLVRQDYDVLRKAPDDLPKGEPLVIENGVPVPIKK